MKKLDERVAKIDNFFIAYHRTKKENLVPIINNGFRPGYGSMYGKGFYLTYDLSSQTRSSMTSYGDGLLKAKINPKNLLIFDYNVSKDIFGKKYTLEDQLITHYKIYRDILDIPRDLYEWSRELEKTFDDQTFSADLAYNKFVQRYVNNGHCSIRGIRGIIFSGNHDGNVLVLYSHETAIPIEFAITDPDNGKITLGWVPVKNYDSVMNRANLAEFVLDKFHGQVRQLYVDKYDFTRLERDFKWLFQATMKNAIIKINDDKTFEWLDGEWIRGHWYGDKWLKGTFISGVWHSGEFVSGEFKYGSFLNGHFNGFWSDGIWRKGQWGQNAIWSRGEIENNRGALIQSKNDPVSFFALNESKNDLKLISKLFESFTYDSLTPEEQDELFNSFEASYKQAVGSSWDQRTFERRASNWLFFGSEIGGIAVRKQNSGMYKFNAVFGSPRQIIPAYNELNQELRNEAVWGVMTLDIAKMLEKLSRKEFKMPPKLFTKTVIPHIAHIFGDRIVDFTNDGGIIVDTPSGRMTKYLIANRNYYKLLLDNATKHPEKVPVPQPILKSLIAMLKIFI